MRDQHMDEQTPTHSSVTQAHRHIACPYCRSTETELLSLFGQQLLTIQLYCHTCHTPFEAVKDDELLQAYDAARKEEPL
jgi:DNA-directed RNA polymerase subunit RPC12/RpoP